MSREEAIYGRLLWEVRKDLEEVMIDYRIRLEDCYEQEDYKLLHEEMLGEIEAIRDKI